MKKNYMFLAAAFLFSAVTFGQTNLILNGNFADNTLWAPQPNAACAASGITFDAGDTHTADGSGSWSLNCANANNRLRNVNGDNAFTTNGAGDYTVTVWVKKTGVDDGILYVYLGPTTTPTTSTEGNFDVTSTSWVEVTRTFTGLPAATTYNVSFSNAKNDATSAFSIDDVVVYENATLNNENLSKDSKEVTVSTTEDAVIVNIDETVVKTVVYNLLGQEVAASSSNTVSTTNLEDNVYIVKVYTENNVYSKRFLKK